MEGEYDSAEIFNWTFLNARLNLYDMFSTYLQIYPWFETTIILLTFFFLLELYLDLRQLIHLGMMSGVNPPKELDRHLEVNYDKLTKITKWMMNRILFTRMEAMFEYCVEFFVLFTNMLNAIWTLSGDILVFLEINPIEYEITRGILFVFIVSIFGALIRLPFRIYSIFYIDSTTDFTELRSTVSASHTSIVWFGNQFKMFTLSFLFGIPTVGFILMVLKWDYEFSWLILCFFLALIGVIVTEVYQVFIRMFESFKPLPDNDLRQRISRLAMDMNLPLKDIVTVHHNSMRSIHSNAFIMGFRSQKTIVIYDSLLKLCSDDEILAIMCHELGHHKYHHMYKTLFLQVVAVANFVWILSRVIALPAFYVNFGFSTMDEAVGLVLFSFLYSNLANIVHCILNVVNQKFEFDADRFALENGFTQMDDALISMHAKDILNLFPDQYYSYYHHSHPSLMARLDRISRWKAKHQ